MSEILMSNDLSLIGEANTLFVGHPTLFSNPQGGRIVPVDHSSKDSSESLDQFFVSLESLKQQEPFATVYNQAIKNICVALDKDQDFILICDCQHDKHDCAGKVLKEVIEGDIYE